MSTLPYQNFCVILQDTIEKQKIMLDRQVLDTLDSDLPQWEKDFIDKRLYMAQHYPERLIGYYHNSQ